MSFMARLRKESCLSCSDRVKHRVRVGKWTHFCLSHACASMFSRSSTATIYINARALSSNQLRYPRFSSSTASLTVGISSSAPSSTAFRGQLGPLYAFCDVVKAETVTALYSMGPSFDSDLSSCDTACTFVNIHQYQRHTTREPILPPLTSQLPSPLPPPSRPLLDQISELSASLFDGRLSEKVVLLLSPRAADERSCPDNSAGGKNLPMELLVPRRVARGLSSGATQHCAHLLSVGASGSRQSCAVKLLGTEGATKVLIARGARLATEAVGGLRAVLMLFSKLDDPPTKGDADEEKISSVEMCLRVLTALLRHDELSQLAVIRNEAYALAAMLTADSSGRYLTADVIRAIFDAMQEVRAEKRSTFLFLRLVRPSRCSLLTRVHHLLCSKAARQPGNSIANSH